MTPEINPSKLNITKIFSAALNGLDSEIVEIEASLGGGDFGQISIVGLPDASVAEARERVRSAIVNSGFDFPKRKITINLAPASLKKVGAAYDLPIALAILSLKLDFKIDLSSSIFAGELSLSGKVRPISGAVQIALAAYQKKFTTIFLPTENAKEATLISNLTIFPVETLKEIINHFQNNHKTAPILTALPANQDHYCQVSPENNALIPDFADIYGQNQAKRALEIAIAGGHNLLLFGPPGAGKTTLASAAVGLLPPLAKHELLEVAKISSLSGPLNRVLSRPFRAPHHSASVAAMLGRSNLSPGEITLAHQGILFLDEFPEFARPVIESLREPLESGRITISRASGNQTWPANFILIAATNPCPCGWRGSTQKSCLCTSEKVNSYQRKLSGPILDRVDMHLFIESKGSLPINNQSHEESSAQIRERIVVARQEQLKRFPKLENPLNGRVSTKLLIRTCPLNQECQQILNTASLNLSLSIRSYFKIIRLARTIADLEKQKFISSKNIAEALRYRQHIS